MPRLLINPWRSDQAWRASRPKFLAVLLVAAFAIALYQLFSNPLFFVDTVQITGNRLVGANDLGQASGIRGWNIFFVDAREVENSLRNLPEVKGVRVSISLPNRVQVEVIERLPRFVYESRGATYWVDDDGIALRVRANLPGLLALRDADGAPVKVGERVNVEAFNAAVSLRNAWPDGPRAFEWSREHGLAIRESQGWLVYFGSASQISDKLAALRIVEAAIKKDNKSIEFIDLGNGLPYYREAIAKK